MSVLSSRRWEVFLFQNLSISGPAYFGFCGSHSLNHRYSMLSSHQERQPRQ